MGPTGLFSISFQLSNVFGGAGDGIRKPLVLWQDCDVNSEFSFSIFPRYIASMPGIGYPVTNQEADQLDVFASWPYSLSLFECK